MDLLPTACAKDGLWDSTSPAASLTQRTQCSQIPKDALSQPALLIALLASLLTKLLLLHGGSRWDGHRTAIIPPILECLSTLLPVAALRASAIPYLNSKQSAYPLSLELHTLLCFNSSPHSCYSQLLPSSTGDGVRNAGVGHQLK